VSDQEFVVELSSSELFIKTGNPDEGGSGSTSIFISPDRPSIASRGSGELGGVVVAVVGAEEEAPIITGGDPFPIDSSCSVEIDGNVATAQGVSVGDTIFVSWNGSDFPAPISESGMTVVRG
jgi:hypothetical protein